MGRSRMQAYRSVNLPLNVLDFTASRHRDGPDLMPAGYAATLLADCDSGCPGISLRTDGRIRTLPCSGPIALRC